MILSFSCSWEGVRTSAEFESERQPVFHPEKDDDKNGSTARTHLPQGQGRGLEVRVSGVGGILVIMAAWWHSGLRRWSPNSGNTGSNPTQGVQEIKMTTFCVRKILV